MPDLFAKLKRRNVYKVAVALAKVIGHTQWLPLHTFTSGERIG
jgi:hypothetical protein